MTYLRAFIPACEGFGWSGGPQFQTRVRALVNGRERRNADWAQERQKYTVPFANLRADQYRGVRQMFQVCRGMLHTFLYADPLDQAASDETFAIGDGVRAEFQLSKLSVVDGVTYQREIHALYVEGDDGEALPATIAVTVSGTPTAVTVDYDRGTVLFAAPPAEGAVLRWSGAFAVWVRFDNDWLPFSINDRGAADYFRSGSVDLIELPSPEPAS
jgi:uncharacterized protein (TIGR02217 family)